MNIAQFLTWAFTDGTLAAAAASGVLNAGLLPLIATVGALAAAVGAAVALYQQLKALTAETGGLGFTGTIGEMVKQGTFDPFKAVDTYQNQQARLAAGAGATAANTNTVNGAPVSVVINAPGQDAAAIGQHAARAVGSAMRQERRAALHSLDHR